MVVLFAIVIKKSEQPLSVDLILQYTPENKILASMIVLAFFALKSLTIIFPLSMLYFANGILFQSLTAVLISTIGLAITITIPYLIGKYLGKQAIQRICEKYPKAEHVKKYQETNTYFACFITRIVGVLPGDIVSLYFGACGTPYLVYLSAGVAGSLISIVTYTLLGAKISDPLSIEFMLVLLCRIIVSIGAIVINYKWNQRKYD